MVAIGPALRAISEGGLAAICGRYLRFAHCATGELAAVDALAELAEEAGISPIEMAIAFVTRHPAVTPQLSACGRWSTASRR